ncbi:MAG: hypothetical protein JXR03_06500 [Cyclobacteriaceae bacterium]
MSEDIKKSKRYNVVSYKTIRSNGGDMVIKEKHGVAFPYKSGKGLKAIVSLLGLELTLDIVEQPPERQRYPDQKFTQSPATDYQQGENSTFQ